MELLKLLSTNEIVAQALGFLLLLFLLRAFAWKKLLKLLDDRKERIAGEFMQIEDAKKEVAEIKAGYEEKLQKIEETARLKLQEASLEGKEIKEQVRQEAQSQAQEIINNAREEIKYELSRAKEELKEKIVDMTISATESLIKEKLTGEQDKKLIKGFLDDLNKLE